MLKADRSSCLCGAFARLMRRLRWVAVAGVALALIACAAGSDFTRPRDGQLALGSTTMRDVLQWMGEPGGRHFLFVNGRTIEVWNYVYARAGAEAAAADVTPVRALHLLFHEQVLVGRRFLSSFRADGTGIDRQAALALRTGMTEHEVAGRLGAPPGLYRYPLIDDPHGKALVYGYFTGTRARTVPEIMVIELDQESRVRKLYLDTRIGQRTPALAEAHARDAEKQSAQFETGWPKLRQGLSAQEVQGLLGPLGCGLSSGLVLDRGLGRLTTSTNRCTLEFEGGKLAKWALHPLGK
jgi:hypothetical protein